MKGLEIWRVNKFDLERVPKNEYGQFYSGDAYVCLKTKEDETFDIHFWLGKDATVDEVGTAAIKAVEMDQALAGVPVQHREVQNHESALFLSYFPYGLRYLKGGYESGFHHVENNLDNFEPRLYHCKGKRNVRCSEVECAKESLNLGDVFILDLGREIYVWMPPESGRLERIKGMDNARHLAQVERHWKSHVNVLDSDWDQEETFWSYFGGVDAVGEVASAKNDDEEYWTRTSEGVGLYRVSDASGSLEITRVEDVRRSELDTNDAFILDAGNLGIYIWIGRKCNMNERGKAIMWGEDYIKQNNLPKWTQVTSVMEGSEPPAFMQWFADWDMMGTTNVKSFEPRLFQVSDRNGRLVVEEIANFNQESLDGDDVMILDARNNIYVWIGAEASAEEREGAESTAEKYLQHSSLPRENANIEIVKQGEETPEFKSYFPSWDDELFQSDRRSVATLRKLFFES